MCQDPAPPPRGQGQGGCAGGGWSRPPCPACPVGGGCLASDVGMDRPEVRRAEGSAAWGCGRGPWGPWEGSAGTGSAAGGPGLLPGHPRWREAPAAEPVLTPPEETLAKQTANTAAAVREAVAARGGLGGGARERGREAVWTGPTAQGQLAEIFGTGWGARWWFAAGSWGSGGCAGLGCFEEKEKSIQPHSGLRLF